MYIGLDIGGSKIRAGLLDNNFNILDVVETPTRVKQSKQVVLNDIYEAVASFPLSKVKGIGIAIRGFVDFEKGMVLKSTMMPGEFKNVKIAEFLKKKTKKRVVVENDTNCFALAEAVLGAGKEKKSVVGITLGTGIGGGIIQDKKVFRSTLGGAGEVGHMVIDPNQYKWNTGQRGPFEGLCSGTAMKKLYYMRTKKKVTAMEVEERFYKKEKAAQEVMKEMSMYLSIGLANLIHILDPDITVIGGGLSRAKCYVDPAIKQVPKRLIYSAHKKSKIVYSKLGQHAGLIGAALLAKK